VVTFSVRPVGWVRAGRDDPADTDHWETWRARSCSRNLPRVGVFCDRGPRRPNRIGVTSCRIRAVDGRELRVQGLDAVVGTPVPDVKPVMREFLARDVRQPAWVGALMGQYFQP
jgi:tRNA (adenine37-N6)-methyltransferase